MSNYDIIPEALEYYDKFKLKNRSIINEIDRVELKENSNDIEDNHIIFYNKNNKIIKEAPYEVMSIYDKENKIWIWAWADCNLYKNQTKICRKLLEYSLNIDIREKNEESRDQLIFIKSNFITSRLYIESNNQLDINIGLACYLSKSNFIYKYQLNDNPLIYYMIIK